VKTETKSSVWISQAGNFLRGSSVPAEAAKRPILSWFDDGRVLLNSQRSGFPNFLRLDLDTQKRTVLTDEAHFEEDAAVVRDTGAIVFTSNRTGQFHIWKYDPRTNQYTQLTFGAGYDRAPSVSHDGKWVAYINFLADIPHLRRINIDGTGDAQIGSFRAQEPQISPDGKWIAAQIQDSETANWNVAIVAADGTGERKIVPNAQVPFRWAPKGNALTSVLTDERGVSNVWNVPPDGSPMRKLTDFDDEAIQALAWSPSGDRLGCIRAVHGSDAVLFKRQAN
jgi:Tol biopolymer transport system component